MAGFGLPWLGMAEGVPLIPSRGARHWLQTDAIGRICETMSSKKNDAPRRIAADNRRARFDYEIKEAIEAGVSLTGTEVKSLRTGKATIGESYAAQKGGEMWLFNAYIPEILRPTASIMKPAARASFCCTSGKSPSSPMRWSVMA